MADFRFTPTTATTTIPYWIDPDTTTANCRGFWVKISTLPAGTNNIYMYYGNGNAVPVSSGPATFIFYKNDFATADLGWNWSNGSAENGMAKTWATSADNPGSTMVWIKNIVSIAGIEAACEYTVSSSKYSAQGHVTTNTLFNPTQTTGLYNNTGDSTIANGSGNSIITMGDYTGWYGKVGLDATTGQGNNITNDAALPFYTFGSGFVRHCHKLLSSSLKLFIYSNTLNYTEKTITSGYTKPNSIILAIGEHYNEAIWLKEAFVRKCAPTEPTITSVSLEESAFFSTGTYKSAVIDTASKIVVSSISWNPSSQPTGTNLAVGIRVSSYPFSINSSTPSWLTISNGQSLNWHGRYIQYQSTFTTTNSTTTPRLEDISISYRVKPWQEKSVTRTLPNSFGFGGGEKWEWQVPVKGGQLVTISAYIRYNTQYQGASYDKPKLTLSGLGINESISATSSAENSWELRQLSGTPSADGILTLRAEGFSSNPGAKFFIDDINISQ